MVKLERYKDIPGWMLEKNEYKCYKKSNKANFLKKNLNEYSKVIQTEIFSEKNAAKNGYLQLIDPRVKFITLLFYMIFCAGTKSFASLFLLFIIFACFAFTSKLNLISCLKRVWVIPLIVFLLSVPAATNLFFNGESLFYISKNLYISYSGLEMIAKMAFRIGISISFAYILIMTTRWSCLTKAFSILNVPAILITILNMTYRYIFLISKTAFEMMEARFLRTVGKVNNKSNRMFIAKTISFLFIKTSYLSDEIYEAMRCRCYIGKTVSLSTFKLRKADYLWMLNNILIILVLFMGELLH